MKALLAGAEGLRYADVLRLILGTGLRRGEALALRWSDVRLDRAEITVRGSLVRREGRLVVSETKSARSRRTVSLSLSPVRPVAHHRAEQNAERLLAGNLWEQSGFVFTTELGHPADPRNLLRATTIAAKKANVRPIGVHTLRHTYAATALLNRVPIHMVSRNLGHSSIAITADIFRTSHPLLPQHGRMLARTGGHRRAKPTRRPGALRASPGDTASTPRSCASC